MARIENKRRRDRRPGLDWLYRRHGALAAEGLEIVALERGGDQNTVPEFI